MGDKVENRQPTGQSASCGEVSGLQDEQPPPFIDEKVKKGECFGATAREVSGLQDLLTPFFTPQEVGGRR